MKLLLGLLFTAAISANATTLEWTCADDLDTRTVAEALNLPRSREAFWCGALTAVDRKLVQKQFRNDMKIHMVIYPTQETVDWIFDRPVGDLSGYPQYADEIALAREDGLSMLDEIAKALFNGNRHLAREHVMSSGADLVQQYEFERRHLLSYLNASGIETLDTQRIARRGPRAWAVMDVPLHDAVKFARFAQVRGDAWLERLELYDYSTPMVDFSSTCSISP